MAKSEHKLITQDARICFMGECNVFHRLYQQLRLDIIEGKKVILSAMPLKLSQNMSKCAEENQ